MDTEIFLKTIDLSKDEAGPPTNEEEAKESFRTLLHDTIYRCGVLEISKQSTSRASTKWGYGSLFTRKRGGNQCIDLHDEGQYSKVSNSILRYVKLNDRWVAFTSLLLKSQLYRSSMKAPSQYNHSGELSRKPLVVLPRTEAGKPYIPADEKNEQSSPSFNISHQFPFVGLAYINGPRSRNSDNGQNSVLSLLLGLDIVMFDAYKETFHLYSSIDEFLGVFEHTFTPWEWSCIKKSSMEVDDGKSNARIKEFFLRWSIKEAYTKALGTGMSTEFSSFETRLYDMDENGAECYNLCSRVLKEKDYTRLKADVIFCGQEEKEPWHFIFKPLYRNDTEKEHLCGCACICIGKVEQDDLSFDLNFSTTKLDSVINYHLPAMDEKEDVDDP